MNNFTRLIKPHSIEWLRDGVTVFTVYSDKDHAGRQLAAEEVWLDHLRGVEFEFTVEGVSLDQYVSGKESAGMFEDADHEQLAWFLATRLFETWDEAHANFHGVKAMRHMSKVELREELLGHYGDSESLAFQTFTKYVKEKQK